MLLIILRFISIFCVFKEDTQRPRKIYIETEEIWTNFFFTFFHIFEAIMNKK